MSTSQTKINNMKKIFLSLILFFTSITTLTAQNTEAGMYREDLKVIYVNTAVSTHFVSPEKIAYVDISINDIAGDIPLPNAVRIKPLKEGASGVITITSERYMVQYLLLYTEDLGKVYSRYNIPYSDVKSYLNPESGLTRSQLYDYSFKMLSSKNRYYNVSSTKHGMKVQLNNIYTLDKYFFIDLSMFNQSNIQFDIEDIQFYVIDKKQKKSTSYQRVDIFPILTSQEDKSFKRTYRNIFVFEKFTFPEEKIFVIELSEKQLSGRTIKLQIEYKDILNADIF